ncbi:MAG: tripartite tricarboxylate transporter substrate binding protein [Betaproteobacteria bacterium]|nr:tripartite tricarboxylate transporter substrate binding protein [Betaproteobacteria bacterium]
MNSTLKRLSLAVAFSLSAVASPALAQTFPSKPVTMVVAFPAGGASDVLGRIMAKGMQEHLGQPIVVDNVVGVGGSLGVLKAANANPDGHTILAGSPLELIYTPLGVAAAKNKPEDMRLLALVGHTTMAIAVRKDLPVNTLAEFLEYAKKAEKPLSFGSTGVGSLYHLMAETALQIGGAKGLHIPYNGLAPYLKDLAGGQIDFAVVPVAGPVPGMIEAGNFRAIAQASAESNSRIAKVPLAKATKGFENYNFSIWIGIEASHKVPEAAANTIHKAAYAALANPEVRKSVEASGSVVGEPMTLPQLKAFYEREMVTGAAVAKSVNLQPQ